MNALTTNIFTFFSDSECSRHRSDRQQPMGLHCVVCRRQLSTKQGRPENINPCKSGAKNQTFGPDIGESYQETSFCSGIISKRSKQS